VYERRKLKRRHLIYYLRVFDRNNNKLIGHLVDITPEGVMLISEEPIPLGQIFRLKMLLPSRIGGREEWHFDAESRWCDKDINPDFYDTGFALITVEKRDMKVIEDLIQGFGFKD
jgi:hypothetical protein